MAKIPPGGGGGCIAIPRTNYLTGMLTHNTNKALGDQTGFVFINFCLKTNIPLYLRLLVVLIKYNLWS